MYNDNNMLILGGMWKDRTANSRLSHDSVVF